MADGAGLESNQQLGRLMSEGPDSTSILRGFIGTSDREGYIRLFPSLADTSVSVEIAEGDIVDSGEVQGNQLGKRIVWVRRGAHVTVTKSHTTPYGIRPKVEPDPNLRSVRSGRLNMQVPMAAPRDVCASVCSCGTCQSQCTDVCGICICLPTATTKPE